MTTLDDLRAALAGAQWLTDAESRVRREPDAAGPLFARADRKLGREPLPGAPGWTAGQAGRAILLAAVDPDRVVTLYQQGDANERLAVLKALPLLAIGDAGVPLLHDALRTNDTRLVGAALGAYAAHLDQASWRQGVIKCVFMGVPLDVVDRLTERADDELIAMLAGLAEERAAAGRTMPADATALLDRRESSR
jgi:hypothetical protein